MVNTLTMNDERRCEAATIQDCIDLYVRKGMATLIDNGKVVGFVKEKRVPGTVHAVNNSTSK